MRVLAFLLGSGLCGCSLVYGTGDLREEDGGVVTDASADVALDGSADADVPADADVLEDADVPEDAGPDAPDVDVGPECTLELPPMITAEVSAPGWPVEITLTFDPLNCSGTMEISDIATSMEITTRDVVAGDTSLTFMYNMYNRRVPLFEDPTTFRISNGDDLTDTVESSLTLLPSVEEFIPPSMPAMNLEWTFSPTMDIANNGTVVFSTANNRSVSPREQDIILWEVRDPGADPVFTKISQTNGESFAPRISDDGNLVVYAERVGAGSYHYYNVMSGRSGEFDQPTSTDGIADNGQADVRSDELGYYISFSLRGVGSEADYRVFEFSGDNSTFNGDPIAVTQELANAEEGRHPVAVLSTTGNGVAFVNSSGHPELANVSSSLDISEENCNVPNTSRVVMNNGGGKFAFVGRCDAATSDALYVDEVRVEIQTDSAFDGLIGASDDLSWLLLSNRAPGIENDQAFIIARMGTASNDEPAYRILNIDLDGRPAPSLVGQRFDAASISPNGRWAVYALTNDTDSTMRMMRVRVH